MEIRIKKKDKEKAIIIVNKMGEKIGKLSLNIPSIKLNKNEFVIKDYSENEELIKELIEKSYFQNIDRFIIIGSRLYPVLSFSEKINPV
ncbi:MAG: hypothetical protein ACTSQP_12030 [Promethearchaeota archaeon]